MAKTLLKIFNCYLRIHIVYFLIAIVLLVADSYEKFLNIAFLDTLVVENIFFFIISCIYIISICIISICMKNIIQKKEAIINIVIIVIINLLSLTLIFSDPFGFDLLRSW